MIKFLKESTGESRYGTTIIVGDNLRLEEDGDGRVRLASTALGAEGSVLDDLNDVTVITPSNGQFLGYNGASWVNVLITSGVLPNSGNYLRLDGSTPMAGNLNMQTYTITLTGGGTGINMGNRDIININSLTFSDPGTNEGLQWNGGSGWRLYESPNDLSNAGGNLQVVLSGTRIATFEIDSTFESTGVIRSLNRLEVSRSTGAAADILHLRDTVDTADLVVRYDGASVYQVRTETGGAGNLLMKFGPTDISLSAVDWADSDDGSGSGLDSDLLDGVQGADYTRRDLTFLGTIGSVSYDSVTDTAGEWAALPVGYARMMRGHVNSGHPVTNFGYFIKVANRDFQNGWGGLWAGYTAGQNYIGRSVDSGTFATWDKLWSDINDGAGSGLDSDLLDGQHGTFYLDRTNHTSTQSASTITLGTFPSTGGVYQFTVTSGNVINNAAGSQSPLQIYQNSIGSDAFITFHVASDFAAYFGIDSSINDFAVGGWSFGAVSHRIWHQGNDGASSGLDADLLDGFDETEFGRLAAARTWTTLQTFSNGLTISSGVLNATGDAVFGPNGNNDVGIRIRAQGNNASTGHAYLWLDGDSSNDVSEPGGSYVKFTIDNGGTGAFGMIGMSQGANTLPDHSSHTGVDGNSFVLSALGVLAPLQFGVNGLIRSEILTNGTFQVVSGSTTWFSTSGTTGGTTILSTAEGVLIAKRSSEGSVGYELGSNNATGGSVYIDITTSSGVDFNSRINRSSGADGSLQIINSGTGNLEFWTNRAVKWFINGSPGDLLPTPTDTLDIGNTSNRPFHIYAGGTVFAAQNTSTTVAFQVGDDLTIDDVDIGNTAGLRGVSDTVKAFLRFGSTNGLQVGFGGSNSTYSANIGKHIFSGDLQIGSLGTFNSTATAPTTDYVLSFDGTKWVSRNIQLSFTSGDVVASNLTDGTSAALVNSNPTLTGAPGSTPATPTTVAMYKSIKVTMPTSLPNANTVYVIDYSVNGGGFTTNAIIATSNQIVHGNLNPSSTYSYKYLIRGSSDTAYSTASSAINPSNVAEVNTFGVILASQITSPFLSAINANLGTIVAGRVQDHATTPSRIIRFTGGTDPNTIEGVTTLMDLAPPTEDDPFLRVSEPAISIASTTNATPIVVSGTIAHGYQTGDQITIAGHATNTAANGIWVITVISPATFSLDGSVGNGVGGATGKFVRNKLLVRRSGAAEFFGTVRGTIQAIGLTVVGSAVVNNSLTGKGNTLFHTLQVSALGTSYGSSVKRFMWNHESLRMYGDDEDANLDTAFATIGDYDVPSGALTLQQDLVDGGASSVNTTTLNTWVYDDTPGTKSYNPSDANMPAYDDKYYVEVSFELDSTLGTNTLGFTSAEGVVEIRYQINSDPPSGWIQVADDTITELGTVNNSPFVSSVLLQPGDLAASDVINIETRVGVHIHATKILTGSVVANGFVTRVYHYTSTAPYSRRGLYLKGQVVSSVGKPHMFLEPITTAPTTGNSSKGEFWFQDVGGVSSPAYNNGSTIVKLSDFYKSGDTIIAANGTNGAPGFAFTSDTDCGLYRITTNEVGVSVAGAQIARFAAGAIDLSGELRSRAGGNTTFYPVPVVLYSQSVGNVDSATNSGFTLPANTLNADGDSLRITAYGLGAGGTSFRLLFGSTVMGFIATNTNQATSIIGILRRVTSTTAVWYGLEDNSSPAQEAARVALTSLDFTVSNLIEVDTNSATDVNVEHLSVEYIPAV